MGLSRASSKLVSLSFLFIGLLALSVAPLFLPRFFIYLTALVLLTGLLATSLNLALGFGGMYQFNHSVFYGLGAYGLSLMLIKTSLPPLLGYIVGPVISAIMALIMGIICVRLSKLYFGMLQLSLGSLVWVVIYRWYSFTGGDDGLHGVPIPQLFSSVTGSYYFTLVVTFFCMVILYFIVHSPFGRILQAIRDNPERSASVGIRVRLQQLIALVIAGFFAGVAGGLFVTVEGSAFPDLLSWTLSLELIIMCLLGGWFTFFGPMLGAAIIVCLRALVGGYTEFWTLALAIILMLLIYFLPEGALGFFRRIWHGKASASGEVK
ncbi:MAG: branched-chain amino acid ABC transporter permease [Syntrophaceae bacterium]|nr:branched-chain amino acid ABC transporter permease [Syntrophaceae bacterium]